MSEWAWTEDTNYPTPPYQLTFANAHYGASNATGRLGGYINGSWVLIASTSDATATVTIDQPYVVFRVYASARHENNMSRFYGEYAGTLEDYGSIDSLGWNDTVYAIENRAVVQLVTPTNLHTTNITSTGARLHWNSVENAEDYKVEYRQYGQTNWIEHQQS